MNNTIRRVWNMYSMVNIEDLRGTAFQAEDGGHTFEITGVDAGGNETPIAGTVAAVFIRPDNTDVAITGSVSDGKVYVTLTDECYGYPGRFGLTVFLTSDGQKVAIYAAIGSVYRTTSGSVSPETAESVVDLINEIEAAIAQIPASYTDIMSAVAPTYSNTAVYPVGAYAWYEGKLYRCITAITTAESWTAAHWTAAVLGNDVSDLKNALDNYGTYPISNDFFKKTTGTHNGVTYTWSPDGKCTVTGTATSVSVNILFNNQTSLPPKMEVGKQYIIDFVTSDPKVKFSIACYTSGATSFHTFSKRSMFVVPAGTVGMALRLYVDSGTSFTTAVIVSRIDIIDADSLFESFRVVKNAMKNFNAYNLLANGSYVNGTNNGVTFTWNESMTTCTANGSNTSSTASLNTIINSISVMPDGFVAEKNYYLKCKSSSANLRIRIYCYKNGEYYSTIECNADTAITIPSGVTGLSVFVCVPAGTSVSNATITDIAILSSETNEELTNRSLKKYKPTGSTFSVFDDMPDMSYWVGQKTYIEDGITGDVVHLTAGWTYYVYKIKTIVYIVSPAANHFYCGMIRLTDSQQYWSDLTKSGDVYNNYYTTEHYDNSYEINCSPSITTDTNNYLASAGDTTDMTGAIQTMLNNTGICRLGPGDFYVTGIDVPNLASIIGSGNSTRIILAQSATSGYAVKLQSYSTVKDVYIKGSVSNITPTDPLADDSEKRHGIIFEGTASAESPTTFYRSKIEGCTITDFTGGGITCNNTGLNPGSSLCVCNCNIARCGAGINLYYFTEFHRFTNVTSQNNYYGCIDNGGNNNFANCDFSMNKLALLIDNRTGQSRNNTHGTFSACSFHHSDNTYSGGAIVSVGTAIRILRASNGEVFTGCQIGYGDIEIDNSIGVRFVGCNIIRMVALTITNSPLVAFDDCTFYDGSSSPLTQSGNTTLKFNDCYMNNGSVFNPMA